MDSQRISFIFGVTLCCFLIVTGEKCDWRLFQHYEQKGCQAVLGEDGCPLKFQCKPLSDEDLRFCVHKGKIYRAGETINDVGPCDHCTCMLHGESAYIECDAVDCPDWDTKNKSCYMGYKPNQCCPEEICSNEKEKRKTCEYDGKIYNIGEYIQVSNPCRSCICTEEWTDENGPGCSDVNCLTGIYSRKIRNGCIPIYFEKKCCMSEMYCDGINGASPIKPAQESTDGYCQYRGMYYSKGSEVFLDNDKYHCIECKCVTPPDFTCLRKACPPRPKDNCTAVYGHCCPKYECP